MQFQIRGTPIGPMSLIVAVLASMGGFLFGYDTGGYHFYVKNTKGLGTDAVILHIVRPDLGHPGDG